MNTGKKQYKKLLKENFGVLGYVKLKIKTYFKVRFGKDYR